MDCSEEERLIRKALADLDGVHALNFDLLERTLRVDHEPEVLPLMLARLSAVGMTASVRDGAGGVSDTPGGGRLRARWEALRWQRLLAGGIAALAAEALHFWQVSLAVVVVLSLVAVFTAGLETYWKGWLALRHGVLSMNALMSIAVTGAMIIGEWPEAAAVMVLFALAELLEARSLDRARNAVRKLMALAPETASVRQDDGSWQIQGSASIAVGAVVRVNPGERLALDGEVLEGNSTLDQSPITGESMPVEKAPGDQVFAGSVNQAGSLIYRVTALADGSTISRIIHAVQESQASKAPTQRFVDRFARVYTPTVFAIALLVLLIPPLFFGEPWTVWVSRALVLLVIACPCALVISTPVTIVSGLAAAARRGVLIKGGAYLEAGHRLRAMALDKTGTLTAGRPAIVSEQALDGETLEDVKRLAGALARRSDHPVSRALASYVGSEGGDLEVGAFTALAGRGTRGRIAGRSYHLGNHRLIHELDRCTDQIDQMMKGLEAQGRTALALIDERRVIAVFGVADTVRDTSREAIAQLHALGIHTVMLSGDNRQTAAAVAAQVGIDEVDAELLPEEKLKALDGLQARLGTVGMVGDGINDAPALARADVGFAMGAAGSDTAIETADVALMDDDLRKLPWFVALSRRTAKLLTINIAIALAIKAIFFALALLGEATMWMAVFADMGATLIVVSNGLRLLRQPGQKGWSR